MRKINLWQSSSSQVIVSALASGCDGATMATTLFSKSAFRRNRPSLGTSGKIPTSTEWLITCRMILPWDPVVTFNPGSRSEIMFMRACVVIDPLMPGMGLGLHLPKDTSGGFALVSYSAFVNEPG